MSPLFYYEFRKPANGVTQPICPITADSMAEAWEKLGNQNGITAEEALEQHNFQRKEPYVGQCNPTLVIARPEGSQT